MLSKRFESTEVDCRTWLHVPSGTHWSISSDTKDIKENVCTLPNLRFETSRSPNVKLTVH